MRAARLHGVGDLRVEEVPEPQPGAGEVLVRVRAVGICRSDLHLYETGAIGSIHQGRPLVPGHEAGGVTLEDAPGLPAGTRVAIEPTRPCRKCPACARGDYHVCPTLRFLSLPPTDGAMQEVVACPPEWLLPVPDSLPDHLMPLVEPLAVALHAVRLAGEPAGMVVILGAGAIGLLLVQLAVRTAAQVIVSEPLPERRALAHALGAAAVLDPTEPDFGPRLWEAVGHWGAPVVFEAAGRVETIAQAVQAAAPGGRVVVVGIPEEADRVEFPASVARRREIALLFSRRYRHCFAQAIDLLATGRVQGAPLVTHRFPLERAAEAFASASARRAGIRTVIET